MVELRVVRSKYFGLVDVRIWNGIKARLKPSESLWEQSNVKKGIIDIRYSIMAWRNRHTGGSTYMDYERSRS